MLKSKCCFILMLVSTALISYGQSDTSIKLSYANFLQLVKQNHPLAKQANLIPKTANVNTLLARGSFDPKLFYEFNNKFFDKKNYYELSNGGLKIPTWYGIEFKTGFERNQGFNVNPENTSPNQGLLYSQISLPLLQGLIIDERRSALKQAKLFQELSVYEKINTVNELLYKAGKAYWDWQLSFTNAQVLQNAVRISQERVDAIKATSELGDRPAIDTVEAIIQLQDRVVASQQALMDYRTKSLFLSNFLWLENDIPVELTDKTIPEIAAENYDNENTLLANLTKLDSIINNHPSIKAYDFKLQQLSIEKKLKKDKLKPNLNFNYNPLFDAKKLSFGFQNNYKWGLVVMFPLLLRKERADLQLTKIKIENTTYETLNKRNELMNKIKATFIEFNTFKNQIDLYSKNLLNYKRLWQSEKRMFDSGESSLFMINSREMSYINAQIKLNEIINKSKKAGLDVEYSFGMLDTMY